MAGRPGSRRARTGPVFPVSPIALSEALMRASVKDTPTLRHAINGSVGVAIRVSLLMVLFHTTEASLTALWCSNVRISRQGCTVLGWRPGGLCAREHMIYVARASAVQTRGLAARGSALGTLDRLRRAASLAAPPAVCRRGPRPAWLRYRWRPRQRPRRTRPGPARER